MHGKRLGTLGSSVTREASARAVEVQHEPAEYLMAKGYLKWVNRGPGT
jgi:hypothetical protein